VIRREESAGADRGPSRPAAAVAALAIGLLLVRDALLLPEWRILGDVALAAALVLVARERGLRLPSPGLLAVAGLAWTVSHVVALDPGASLEALAHDVRLLAAFTLGAMLIAGSTWSRRAIAAVVVACSAVMALHGWLQVAWLHPRLVLEAPALAGQLADARANSVLVLPGHLAALLAAALALGAGLALATRGRARAATVVLLLITATGLMAARSFSGVLLAAGGLAIVALVSMPARARRWAIGATIAGGAALVVASLGLRSGEIARENPAVARARNWRTAASIVREAPLAGHGGGSFAVEHVRLRPRASNDVRHAHQAFLEAAAEHGLVALPLLVAGAAAVLLAGLRATRGDSSAPLAAGCLGASAVLIGHGLLDFGWSLDSFGGPAAFLLGTTWALVERPRASKLPSLAFASAVVVSFLVSLAGGVAEGLAERALLAASGGEHGRARELLARARRLDPLDDEWCAEGSAAALALAREGGRAADLLEEADGLARRAVALSPRKAARHELLARVLEARGRRVEAAAAALRASQLAPQQLEIAQLRDRLLAGLDSGGRRSPP